MVVLGPLFPFRERRLSAKSGQSSWLERRQLFKRNELVEWLCATFSKRLNYRSLQEYVCLLISSQARSQSAMMARKTADGM
jgi:hypothetical protein